MFALFNKDKNFIGYSDDIPDNSLIIKKEIPKEFSDIRIWKWEGNYDDGKMVPIDIGYPIEEIQLENELFTFINENYPLQTQLLNIIKQLKKITNSNQDIQDDSFSDMADYILNAVEKYNKRINYYKNYERMIPKHESRKQFENAFGM